MKITAVNEKVRTVELDSIEVRNAIGLWLWIELGWRLGPDWKYEVPEMDGLTAIAVVGGISHEKQEVCIGQGIQGMERRS